uniref:Tubulin-specific chaperone D n=1 Tax=Haemonchus placei TaxID=6290 RepID=A0A0N4WGC6_HAEPC
LNQLSVTALRYIAHLTKVRGYKVIVRLLPHHVSFLDKLLTVLEQYTGNIGTDLYERHMLLLWLWIVCKNPFDFRRFDPLDQPGSTTSRILSVASSYLKYPWSTPAAILVIAQCLARHDCIPLIPNIVSECAGHLIHNSENLLCHAVLICAILKHVDRKHLLPHVSSIREAVAVHFPLKKSEKDSLTRKVFIKLVQRLALVVLKPRLAAWRYRRGRRRLEENLMAPKANGDLVSANDYLNNNHSGANDICMEEDEDEHPDEVVEWAIGCVLCALSDDHTTVRWSAAKGVGRITARLPKEFAVQVVDSILSSNFHRLAGHCSWHGGCLALAELSRRGFLLPEALDRVLKQALFYEEPMGRHAFGSNVRDAACYVLWAFARAYEPDELKTFVDSVATSLMCVALFDREVNLRRAASAAFQENVGRQANFPDGIALLTTVDYYTVGNRWRCYTKACLEVVRYPKYADAIVDHLVDNKVTHWDELIREQAAMALGLLAPLHSEYVSNKLGSLLNGCVDISILIFPIVHRHGYLLALSHCIRGLLLAGFPCSNDVRASFILLRTSLDNKWALARHSAVDALGEIFSRRPCKEWIPPVFDALFCAVEDYTTDCHGDIGRFVSGCYLGSSIFQNLSSPRTNLSFFHNTFAIHCQQFTVMSMISFRFVLNLFYSIPISQTAALFLKDSVFLSITPLLLCEEYYTDLICGFVISAGGVSEGTTMRASQALMEYQLSTSKDLKRFLETVADLFDVGRKVVRIGDSVLRLLPQILSRLHVLEQCPDSSTALSRLLLHLTKIVNSRTASPFRIKCALNSLCSLLGCNRDSITWRTAMQLVVRSLSSSLPVVRRAAAEGLYENVCLTDVDDQVLLLLTETVWQDTSPTAMVSIHDAASTIERILLLEGDSSKTMLS